MSLRDRYLYGGGLWHLPRLALLPLSLLYPLIGAWRYRLATPRRFPFFTISLGNLVAGGTGKTPLTIVLARLLTEHGLKVGILSRGYGGSYREPYLVVTESTPWRECGDEPLLMARRTAAQVVVSRQRIPGALYLQQQGVDVVLLDDAFSNHKLVKDFEILLLDHRRPLGNGLPIPSGLLREFPSAIARADLVIRTRVEEHFAGDAPAAHYAMSCSADRAFPISAYSALGNNRAFFEGLQQMGYRLERTLALPDHGVPTDDQLEALSAGGHPLVTSEKDHLKLSTHWQPRVMPVGLALKLLNTDAPLENLLQRIKRHQER
ncbi:tetraacyldisaccharide 4'-kinase [Desulfurispirillum indicum S5]|uniref:Tetraacyldisaccharide 4'-kinase n=1 Tax=Desulfurispirillum indicum (strain ATCC BAA-1389 / DSM 22839 / S5) TaxID=653733 RepID=E6W435_DESIS|nr:tetraacyldisaccharide 4'-kinase [Desulfurispirillum indicum]ADU66999.1 tetraacyldisaccharide 4'-kinase [Desulfurispirillum indicum S5]